MNLHPSFTNVRSYLSDQFSTLRMRALRDLLWAKVTGREAKLDLFPEEAPEKSPNRRFLGVQEIPLHAIVGTINRQDDFDRHFRPLRQYLRDRWVNAYLALEEEGWPPILVHQVGETYYVEDGHHRVSVAQTLGMRLIQARIWEYPCLESELPSCAPEPCPELLTHPVYAGAAE